MDGLVDHDNLPHDVVRVHARSTRVTPHFDLEFPKR